MKAVKACAPRPAPRFSCKHRVTLTYLNNISQKFRAHQNHLELRFIKTNIFK